jgi:hypothetical protein
VAEHHVGHAAGEQRHPGAAAADGWHHLRQGRRRLARRRQHGRHLPQPRRQQPHQAQLLGQRHQAQPLRDAGWRQRLPHAFRIGKQVEQHPAMKPIVRFALFARALHGHAERLDQLAVLHARRARRLAGPAIQAQFQMPPHFVIELQPAIGHRTHQVDPAARAVVFVAQFGIRRAGGGTQAAVHAVQEQLVIDAGARIWVGVRRGRTVRRCGGGAGNEMGLGRLDHGAARPQETCRPGSAARRGGVVAGGGVIDQGVAHEVP